MKVSKDIQAAAVHVITFDQAYQAMRSNHWNVADQGVVFGAALEALGKCSDEQVADMRRIEQEMSMKPIEKI
jgi:hypothetical protein|tara:strand:+ start:69 stop:284 length:216 start_codon:yes stop_codon:yes gene_type:complete